MSESMNNSKLIKSKNYKSFTKEDIRSGIILIICYIINKHIYKYNYFTKKK
jgi:hypothetical protein